MNEKTALRTANDLLKGKLTEPKPLFDGFWRMGETALLFGVAGAGKSILAMQVADAIARGKPLPTLKMPTGARKVLYVDLDPRLGRFRSRYTFEEAGELRRYKFADTLFRETPPADEDIVEWLASTAKANGIKVVIVDDLSALARTYDGTREMLDVFRRLRRAAAELDLSLLVTVNSLPPGRFSRGEVSEADLRRSRLLCDVADSVFAIGVASEAGADRQLVQFRSSGSGEKKKLQSKVQRLDDGMPGFKFEEPWSPAIDEKRHAEMREIIKAHDEENKTFREIAVERGCSKSYASKLYKEGKALDEQIAREHREFWDEMDEEFKEDLRAMDEEELDAHSDLSGYDMKLLQKWALEEYENRVADPLPGRAALELDRRGPPADLSAIDNGEDVEPPDPHSHDPDHAVDAAGTPAEAALERPDGRRSVYDLERAYDSNGREIFVEEYQEPSNKPKVYYYFDSKGKLIRTVRNIWGGIHTRLGKTEFI